MNSTLTAILVLTAGLLSSTTHAAPGEFWEVTNKMEMAGMPFAMPATTTKVCISKGGESDPRKTSGDKDCQMTDVKTIGKKTTWKARCNHDGEVMTGVGEQTVVNDGYQGKIQFSGKSQGHDMNMNMEFSGKRIGGSCDTEEAGKKIKAQLCDTSNFENTAHWISVSDIFLQKDTPCVEQRKQLCELVRKDTPKDARAYSALVTHDQQSGRSVSVAKECKLDMAATTKSICKTINAKSYNELMAYCPAEAKTYREVQRRKECEGRSYTAATRSEDLQKCMNNITADDSSNDSPANEAPARRKAEKQPAAESQSTDSSSNSSTTTDILNNAKKLKGLFGF